MKRKVSRIAVTLLAIATGIVLVSVLIFAGRSAKGPLEGAFTFAKEKVASVEKSLTLGNRTGRRAKKLKWLAPYRNDIQALKNPAHMLYGAFDNNTHENFESIINLEDSLHTTLPLIHIYTAWGDRPDQQFPRLQVETIVQLGSIPVITWEPWLTDFDENDHPELGPSEGRDKGGLDKISQGKYDFYITQWCREAGKIQSPIFLRVGHEMNDPYRYPWGPHNNAPADFIAAWKHIRYVFEREGVRNIIWVWSPHPAYGQFQTYYPGDAYVDYVGSGVLNYGTAATWSQWWSFAEIFGNHYPMLSAFNKPIIVSEFGSLAVGGNRSEWYARSFDSLSIKYPLVKSLMFFHYSDDRTTTQQALDWRIINDKETLQEIRPRLGHQKMSMQE
jgi:beta-mannanase